MARRWRSTGIAVLLGLVGVTLGPTGPAHAADPVTLAAGNGVYVVAVRNAGEPGVGTFTVGSGLANPFGLAHPLLFGGGSGATGTSYTSVRVYGGSDYTQGTRSTTPGVHSLDASAAEVTPIGSTGVRTVHTVADQFRLEQVVDVEGTTFEDSVVVIELTLQNLGGEPARFGLRQLLDAQVGLDDGPTLRVGDDPTVLTTATEVPSPPPFTTWWYGDNDTNPEPRPTFEVAGTTVPRPALLQYACQSDANDDPFDHQIVAPTTIASPSAECSTEQGGDSAILSYWGATEETAVFLQAGGSFTVTQTLRMEPARPVPTQLSVDPLLLKINPLAVTALRTHARMTTPAGVPVAGRQVSFTVAGGKVVCSALTDANGDVGCTGLASGLAVLTNVGYDAVFAGDATYAPSQAKAPLVA